MKKLISLLLLISLALSLTSCGNADGGGGNGAGKNNYKTKTHAVEELYFDTETVISTYGDASDEEFKKYSDITDELMKYYHRLFDVYYEYSGMNNIRTINKNAGISPVEVNEDLIIFLSYCKELFTITHGKTNIMLGSVLVIWHDVREIADDNGGVIDPSLLPKSDALAEAILHTSIDSLVIDREAGTVYISDPEASIDVGAVAKGYAVERLYERLVDEGADSMAINAGGNIKTIGLNPSGEKWRIGITNPDTSSYESFACRIAIGEIALVTSGDYRRYFISGGKKYHHIIDPTTLQPAEYFSSVSILASDSGLADALSTALFCMSYDDGVKLVSSLSGVEVIWITKDGTILHTDGVEFIKD